MTEDYKLKNAIAVEKCIYVHQNHGRKIHQFVVINVVVSGLMGHIQIC